MNNIPSTKLENVTIPLNESSFSKSFTEDKQTPLARLSILEHSPLKHIFSEYYLGNNRTSSAYDISKELDDNKASNNNIRNSINKKHESMEMPRKFLNKSHIISLDDSNNFGSYLDKTSDILNNLTVDDLTMKVNQKRRLLIDDEIEKRIKEDEEKTRGSKTKSRSSLKSSLQE